MKAAKMIVAIVLSVVVLGFAVCYAASTSTPTVKVAKIGLLMPFSGPASGWAVPGLTGLNLWADNINKAGGIPAGKNKYKVKFIKYDDEYLPSKSVEGARKLVLRDRIDVLIPSITGDPVSAIQPFCTAHKVLQMGMEAVDCGPKRPYLITGGEGFPMYHALHAYYIKEQYPQVKTCAFFTQDDETGRFSAAWWMAAAEVAGIKVVYENLFNINTVDFAPIVSAAVAKHPDVISLGATYPSFRVSIIEQLYHHGYKGIVSSSEWEPEEEMVKVPRSYLETIKCIGHHPIGDVTSPPRAKKFYQQWIARYGKGGPEDVHRSMRSIDWLYTSQIMLWEEGVKLAGTIDGTKVRDALLAQPTIPALIGTAKWWGKEVFGVSHHALVPESVSEFRHGKQVAIKWYHMDKIYDEVWKGHVLPWMEHYGEAWYQR